jgi:hypothetical protein
MIGWLILVQHNTWHLIPNALSHMQNVDYFCAYLGDNSLYEIVSKGNVSIALLSGQIKEELLVCYMF